jgi:hypothetical protein
MKKLTTAVIATTFLLNATVASAGTFSWYKMKNEILKVEEPKEDKKAKKEQEAKDMIWDRYNVLATKKSVQDISEQKRKGSLIVGVEFQQHPTYEITTMVPTVDPADPTNIIYENVTTSSKLSGTSIFIKGDLDLSPIGIGGTEGLTAKVAMSNDFVDFDISKRFIGESNNGFSFEAGMGLKTVTQANPVFDEGFYGFGTATANYTKGDFTVTLGARALLEKPEIYEFEKDRISTFFGLGYSF